MRQWSVPGPGRYSFSDWTTSSRSRNARKKLPGFHQSAERLTGYETLPPGPGKIAVAVVTRSGALGEYNVFDRIGRGPHYKHNIKSAFSSTEHRKTSSTAGLFLDGPGPAHYLPLTSGAFGSIGKAKESTNFMFKSKQSRFPIERGPTEPDFSNCDNERRTPLCGDPRSLGPGSYNVSNASGDRLWRRLDTASAPFLSSNKRFGHETAEAEPGPGEYKAASSFRWAGKGVGRSNGFSLEDRFREGPPAVPGPGEYNTMGDMNLKSFNVTFDQTQE